MDHCVSNYMEILLNSDFLQFNLLPPKKFVRLLSDFGIRITIKELEYYDKKEIIRPALRLSKPEMNLPDQNYSSLDRNSFSMHNYYTYGLVDLPKEGDFRSWQYYEEKAIELYYHTYQFVPIRQLLVGNVMTLKPYFFEMEHDYPKFFSKKKEELETRIRITQLASKKWWRNVGLLMLLRALWMVYSWIVYVRS